MDSEIFATERLLVRHLGLGDEQALFSVYGDPEAMRWVDDGQPIKWPECVSWVAITEKNYATRGYGMSALVLRESGAVIGFCGVVHPGGQPEPEVKYALLREHWGLGLATEAVRGMISYASERFELRRIIATIAPENTASQRVATKACMTRQETRQNSDGSETLVFAWVQPTEDARSLDDPVED